MELVNEYNKIKSIILECGKLMIEADRKELGIKTKNGVNNIVTKYDVMIQNKLKSELLNIIPNAGFLGEENDTEECINNEYVYIVDPIDGTTNFARDLKLSSISVALLKDGKPLFGFCYNPYINEFYEARRGNGAYLNGERIHVSDKLLKDGIVFCGCSPYYEDLRKESLRIQSVVSLIAVDFRRFGSAVIEICNIASGKAELYYELKLMPWDYAAASLICEEAGGKVTTIDGKDIEYFKPSSIVASNNKEDYFKYLTK